MRIRNQILSALLLLMLVPLGLSLLWLQHYLATEHSHNQDQQLSIFGQSVANQLDGFLHGVVERVRSDSRIPEFGRALQAEVFPPNDEVAALLNNIASRYPVFLVSAALVDVEGLVRYDSKATAKVVSEAGLAYLHDALAGGLPVIRVDRGDLWVAAVVRGSDDRVVGVLRLRFLRNRLQQTLVEAASHNLLPNVHLLLAAADGRVVADSAVRQLDPQARLQIAPDLGTAPQWLRQNPLATTPAPAVQRLLTLPLGSTDWRLLVLQPRADFLASFYSSRRQLWLVLAVALVTLVAAALLAAQRISNPIIRLTEHAEQVARDRRGSKLELAVGGEVGRLADALNHMLDHLQAAMDELASLNQGLEQRVEERTRDLNHSNFNLQRTQDQLLVAEKLAALGALVAGMAHELNLPLGNALLVVTAVEDRLRGFAGLHAEKPPTSEELKQWSDTLLHSMDLAQLNLRRATQLVQSFRQVAVDQTSQQRRHFDLHAVVQETLQALTPSLPHQPLELKLEGPSGLQMDSYPGAIGQILTNLVNNAVKHGVEDHPDGRIQVILEDHGDQLELKVRDNGNGIANAVMDKIFEPFFTTKQGSGGNGLGLSICVSLVQRVLGGSIEAHNVPGGGAEFCVSLPRVAPLFKDAASSLAEAARI